MVKKEKMLCFTLCAKEGREANTLRQSRNYRSFSKTACTSMHAHACMLVHGVRKMTFMHELWAEGGVESTAQRCAAPTLSDARARAMVGRWWHSAKKTVNTCSLVEQGGGQGRWGNRKK